jgi:ribonucleotide reductase beta subunit family protein with ferritin-like domain
MVNEYQYNKNYVLARCNDAIELYREFMEKHGEENQRVAQAKAVNEILEGMNVECAVEHEKDGEKV